MNSRRGLRYPGGAAVLVVAIVGTAVLAHARDQLAARPEQSVVSDTPDSPNRSASDAAAKRIENFPPLQRADPTEALVAVGTLTDDALSFASGEDFDKPLAEYTAAEKQKYRIFATRTTLGELATYSAGFTDSMIASDRPVWTLSVHARIENDHPQGLPGRSWDVYTAVFDAVSGDLICLSTGVDLEALGSSGVDVSAG